ncbi:MAG: phosphonatase-like hydrolase [Anaerolineaceae bacterium]|nr:phosphonatase-like hydrolase [Anaerolineaceae bacterium]
MNGVDLIVFDMAGTTVEDGGQVLTAFMAALRENDIAVSKGELQKWRGASKREVLRIFIERQFGSDNPDNTERVERIYVRFCEQLESSFIDGGVRGIAGVEAVFSWLHEQGVKIALTTGFYRRVTEIILNALGWREGLIDASVCSDDVPRGRPAPFMIFRAMEATDVIDVKRVLKVGDTVLDLWAGRNAGVGGVVGVLSGSQGIEQLGGVKHTHILSSIAVLPALLESEFG